MAWDKPFPNIDADNEPFWEGLRQHRFLLFRCMECGAWYWPKAFCRNHRNKAFFANLQWTEASGRGKVFSFNVHHWAFHPGFEKDLPYVYALIELEEGPLFSTTLVDCRPEEVHVGMPVEILYEDHPEEGFTLPRARPLPTRT